MLSLLNDDKLASWFIFQNGHLIFFKKNRQDLLSSEDFNYFRNLFLRQFHIGTYHHLNCFCAEIPKTVVIPDSFEALSIRKAFEALGGEWYTVLAKAHAIINWDGNHRFCGHCGAATYHKVGGYERLCTQCGLGAYPRISPSIMVLIQKNDHILLARSPHFLPGAYGLIAGFVEVGESLEETIHREVMEEVGLKIKNINYFGSQSWPFPDSLMVGFTADYASGEIQIDNEEIVEAGWYRYNNLPGYPSTSVSLARKLIDYFVDLKTRQHQLKNGSK